MRAPCCKQCCLLHGDGNLRGASKRDLRCAIWISANYSDITALICEAGLGETYLHCSGNSCLAINWQNPGVNCVRLPNNSEIGQISFSFPRQRKQLRNTRKECVDRDPIKLRRPPPSRFRAFISLTLSLT